MPYCLKRENPFVAKAVKKSETRGHLRMIKGALHESVQRYLEGKFGDALEDVSKAMLELARSLPIFGLEEKAYALYEKSRPEIPPGKRGGGASGKLDLDLIRKMTCA
jgi:hypothetical protein